MVHMLPDRLAGGRALGSATWGVMIQEYTGNDAG